MARRFFTGFSTVDSEKTRERTFYDLELCKRDLMNHFHCRPGDRVMRPSWGCRIWDYVMEPLTGSVEDDIAAEVRNVIDSDTRCEIIDLQIEEIDHGVRIEVTFNFIPQNVVTNFAVEFDRRNTAFFS